MSNQQNVSLVRATVSSDPTLERDMSSQAIINRNQTDYLRRLAVKRTTKAKDDELENLKSEVAQLKELVAQLLSSAKS